MLGHFTFEGGYPTQKTSKLESPVIIIRDYLKIIYILYMYLVFFCRDFYHFGGSHNLLQIMKSEIFEGF